MRCIFSVRPKHVDVLSLSVRGQMPLRQRGQPPLAVGRHRPCAAARVLHAAAARNWAPLHLLVVLGCARRPSVTREGGSVIETVERCPLKFGFGLVDL